MAKKTTRRRKSTASAASSGNKVTEALAKRIMKARANGMTWNEVRSEFKITKGQSATVRQMMKDLDPDSVREVGGGRKKTTRKKTTAKKTTRKAGKKSTAKKVRRPKRGGAKKARRPDLESMEDQAILDTLIGSTVTFYRNKKEYDGRKNPLTYVVRDADMLPESKDFGRIVRMYFKHEAQVRSAPLTWIVKVV